MFAAATHQKLKKLCYMVLVYIHFFSSITFNKAWKYLFCKNTRTWKKFLAGFGSIEASFFDHHRLKKKINTNWRKSVWWWTGTQQDVRTWGGKSMISNKYNCCIYKLEKQGFSQWRGVQATNFESFCWWYSVFMTWLTPAERGKISEKNPRVFNISYSRIFS